MSKIRIKPFKKRYLSSWLLSLVLAVIAVCWIMPVVSGAFTSFKSNLEVKMFARDMNLIPHNWTLENYEYVISYPTLSIFRTMGNTVIVCISSIAFTLILCTMSAYGFERFEFKGKETLFWTLFALSSIPNVVALVPQYTFYTWLKWIDRLPSIIAPTIADVFYIFLIRNFMKGIPKELEEAARIDGAGEIKILTLVEAPLLKPVLTIVGIFKFSGAWNDFLWPSIAITTPAHSTITPAIRLLNDSYGGMPERLLAGCMLAMIPTLIVYIVFRKQFLKGLDVGSGIKG